MTRNTKRAPLTPEQEEADREYLERILQHGPDAAELLKRLSTDALLRFLGSEILPERAG